jgi:TonB family protein
MSTYSCSPLFLSVQKAPRENRWGVFVASYIAQATAAAALVFLTVNAPTFIPTQAAHVALVAPDLNSAPRIAPLTAKVPQAKSAPERFVALQPKIEKIEVPVLHVQQPQRVRRITEIAEFAQPQLSVPAPKLDSKILNVLPGPKAVSKIVATNTFGGSSISPTLQKVVPSKVQTGGFGDPNGVPANAQGNNRPNLAAAGSFDLPAGEGNGNGEGGRSGARAAIASAGFGNGVAVAGVGGHGRNAGQGSIQSTGFATATAAPSDDSRLIKAANHQVTSAPVSIQSKPTPQYTSEARQLRVEGEVLLNVVFTAEGQIRILKVLHGLGHGLDESAQRAVQGLRFSPAMRDGHPVDSTVTLHIVFQLS